MACIACRLSKISLSVALIMVFLPVHGVLTAQGQENERLVTRIAEGQSVIISDDLARTRDNAIRDALRKAVGEAVSMLSLDSPALDKLNSQQIERYIYQYGIVSEKQTGVIYSVELNVAVDKGRLKSDLKPRIAGNHAGEITIDARGLKRYGDYAGLRDSLASSAGGSGRVIPKLIKSNQVLFSFYTDERIDDFIRKFSHASSTARVKKISGNVMEIDVESN